MQRPSGLHVIYIVDLAINFLSPDTDHVILGRDAKGLYHSLCKTNNIQRSHKGRWRALPDQQ